MGPDNKGSSGSNWLMVGSLDPQIHSIVISLSVNGKLIHLVVEQHSHCMGTIIMGMPSGNFRNVFAIPFLTIQLRL